MTYALLTSAEFDQLLDDSARLMRETAQGINAIRRLRDNAREKRNDSKTREDYSYWCGRVDAYNNALAELGAEL